MFVGFDSQNTSRSYYTIPIGTRKFGDPADWAQKVARGKIKIYLVIWRFGTAYLTRPARSWGI